ncbi:MAG: MFS transporter [Ginsengibacter sp.]
MIKNTISLYKEAYKGLSRSTWLLALVMLINRSGTMVVPFMTMYLTQHLKVSISKAGFVMSLFGAGAIVGTLIGGRLTDKVGYYYIQIVTLTGGGVMFIILGQMHSYTAICICTFFLAMVNEAFRPANSVAVAHYSKDENRTRSYSVNRLAINLGWALGSALGGIIATYNYSLLFWVDGITNISAAILLYLFLAPSRNNETQIKQQDERVKENSAYKDTTYLIFTLMVFVFAMCFFQLFTTLPVFYKVEFHLSVFFIGMVMALNGLIIAFFEMITVYKLEGRRPHLQFISTGVVLVGISYLLLNVSFINYASLAIISMLFISLGEIFSMPFMNSYWILRTQPYNRGQYAALFSVAWSLAHAAGPLTGSLIAEKYGFKALWIIVGVACMLLGYFYWRLQQKTN